MAPGIRTHFERELARLREEVLELGALVSKAVTSSVDALIEGDAVLAREVIVGDSNVNRMRTEVERNCYALLVTEQPVARDMREIVSALTVSTDLERIGDHAKKIAATYLRMADDPRPIPMRDVRRLANSALEMLDRALQAYSCLDVAEAEAICLADDTADALYKQLFNVTLSYMLEDPRLIGTGTYLLQVAHELERVADRATNIAERVIFTATGELRDLNV